MTEVMHSPAQAIYWFMPGSVLFLLIHLIGITCFAYIVVKRLAPLMGGQKDFRFDRPWIRLQKVGQFWLGQWKHPRYKFAGIIHILIFSGFLILATRAFSLLIFGASGGTATPTVIGHLYDLVADYAATIVFFCMVVAAVRRLVFKPARYAVPVRYGKGHPADAIFLLALIAILMASESLFEAGKVVLQTQQGLTTEALPVLTLAWMFQPLWFSPRRRRSGIFTSAPTWSTFSPSTFCSVTGRSESSSTWKRRCLMCSSPSSIAEPSSRCAGASATSNSTR